MKDFSNSDKNCQQRTGVIYKITNLVNGKCYVGQTTQKLSARIAQHKRCKTSALGKAIQEYGLENFKVEELETCPFDMLDEREIYHIAANNCIVPNGYNSTSGGNINKIVSEGTRLKLSIAHMGQTAWNKGKHWSEEHIAKLSESHKGHPAYWKGKHLTEETRAKISESTKGENHYFYGKHHTDETKAKISATLTGHEVSEETRAKISVAKRGENCSFFGKPAWNRGVPCSEETREKISIALTGHEVSAETRAKMSAAQKGHEVSAETRAKKSLAIKKYWAEKKKNSEEGCEE